MKQMTEKLEVLINQGFDETSSILKQDDILALEHKLKELGETVKKGYSIPQIDTVGMNLTGKVAYGFKGY